MDKSLNTNTLIDTHISLAHGNGGYYMRELIEKLFHKHLANPLLDSTNDACVLKDAIKKPVITTDGFSVQPLEFPGGDIGSLAIHGTVNDLAVAGGIPRYLTLSVFLEEGLEIALLERVVKSMAKAANEAKVQIVAGDTKVVPRGNGGGIYFSICGIGEQNPALAELSINNIQPGDKILISGTVGDHGTAVMLSRADFGLTGKINSDSASILLLVQELPDGVRFLRDPTRGGLATVMHEINLASGFEINLMQQAIPVKDEVNAVCEILGYDPLYLASEGRLVAIVAKEAADDVLSYWQTEGMTDAQIVGHIGDKSQQVVLHTPLGGQRILEQLEDDPLPRIC